MKKYNMLETKSKEYTTTRKTTTIEHSFIKLERYIH